MCRIENKDEQLKVYNNELKSIGNVIYNLLLFLQDNGIVYPPDNDLSESKRIKLTYNVYNDVIKYYVISLTTYVLYSIEKPELLTRDEYNICNNYIDDAITFYNYCNPILHSVLPLLQYEKGYMLKYNIIHNIIGNNMQFEEEDVICIENIFNVYINIYNRNLLKQILLLIQVYMIKH